jgi:hypothetical protein
MLESIDKRSWNKHPVSIGMTILCWVAIMGTLIPWSLGCPWASVPIFMASALCVGFIAGRHVGRDQRYDQD